MTPTSKETGCACGTEQEPRSVEPKLQNLIPIAVAIACGCEPCAEGAVTQALKKNTPKRHIEQTLRIVAYLRTVDCLIQRAGPAVILRMEKPLAAAAAMLEQASEIR